MNFKSAVFVRKQPDHTLTIKCSTPFLCIQLPKSKISTVIVNGISATFIPYLHIQWKHIIKGYLSAEIASYVGNLLLNDFQHCP